MRCSLLMFAFIAIVWLHCLEPDCFGAISSRVVYLQVKWCIISHHIFRSLVAVNFVHGYGISFSASGEHFWRNLSGVNTRPCFCLSLSVRSIFVRSIFVTVCVLRKFDITLAQISVLLTTSHSKMNGVAKPNGI